MSCIRRVKSSASGRPTISHKRWLARNRRPSMSVWVTPAVTCSKIAANRPLACAECLLGPVLLRDVAEHQNDAGDVPRGSRMGAALSSIGRSVLSRSVSTVWFASPTMTPSRSTFATGFSTGRRACWLMIGKTSSRARPAADFCPARPPARATDPGPVAFGDDAAELPGSRGRVARTVETTYESAWPPLVPNCFWPSESRWSRPVGASSGRVSIGPRCPTRTGKCVVTCRPAAIGRR